MAQPLIAETGYTSDELERCISDALAVGKKISYTPDMYSLLFSQWGFKLTVGMMVDSRRVAQEFSELAERQNNEIAKYARYRMLGASHMCLGQLELAKDELRQLIDGYEPDKHSPLKAVYGADLRIAGRCFLSEVLWLLGDIDGAKASAAEALSEAREMEHIHSHALALHFCSLVSFLNRDKQQTQEYSDELLELTNTHVLGAWPTLGRAMNGWATMNAGNFDEKMKALIEGVAQAGWEQVVTEQLLKSPAINVDETSLRVDRKNHWIHVYSAGDITLKHLHRRRGKEAMESLTVIPRYGGAISHDCWSSYRSYTHCAHGLCGSHLLRELTFSVDANDYRWAGNMKRPLQQTCKKVSATKSKQLTVQEYSDLQKRYRNIITRGEKELPAIPEMARSCPRAERSRCENRAPLSS